MANFDDFLPPLSITFPQDVDQPSNPVRPIGNQERADMSRPYEPYKPQGFLPQGLPAPHGIDIGPINIGGAIGIGAQYGGEAASALSKSLIGGSALLADQFLNTGLTQKAQSRTPSTVQTPQTASDLLSQSFQDIGLGQNGQDQNPWALAPFVALAGGDFVSPGPSGKAKAAGKIGQFAEELLAKGLKEPEIASEIIKKFGSQVAQRFFETGADVFEEAPQAAKKVAGKLPVTTQQIQKRTDAAIADYEAQAFQQGQPFPKGVSQTSMFGPDVPFKPDWSDAVNSAKQVFGKKKTPAQIVEDYRGSGKPPTIEDATAVVEGGFRPETNQSVLAKLSDSLPPSQQRNQEGLFPDLASQGQPTGLTEELGKGMSIKPGESLPHNEQVNQTMSGLIPEGQAGAVMEPNKVTFNPSAPLSAQEARGQQALSSVVDGLKPQAKLADKMDSISYILGAPRELMVSGDISAGGRQALPFLLSHPIEFSKAFGKQIVALTRDAETYTKIQNDLYMRTLQNARGVEGLMPTLARAGQRVGPAEERFGNTLARKIPGMGPVVGRTEQAYNTMLNSVRAGVYNNIVESYAKAGKPLADSELRNLAQTIDHFSGRGYDASTKGETTQATLRLMNSLFFAPNFQTSRVRMVGDGLTGIKNLVMAMHNETTPLPSDIEKTKLFMGYIGAVAGMLELANISGLKVDFRPNSDLFGKIEVGPVGNETGGVIALAEQLGFATTTINGKSYVDVTGSLATDVRVADQLLSSFFDYKIPGLDKKPINSKGRAWDPGKPGPFDRSREDIAFRFGEGKLAPVPSMSLSTLRGQDLGGNPVDVGETATVLGRTALGGIPGGGLINNQLGEYPKKFSKNPIAWFLNNPLVNWILPLSVGSSMQASDIELSEPPGGKVKR